MPTDQPPEHFLRAIARHGATTPDAEALKYEDRSVSFGALCGLIGSRSRALRAQGILPGQRVGLVVRDLIDEMVLRLAVMDLGAVPGSMDVFAKPASRAEALARYGMPWVIEDAATHSGLPQSILADRDWLARADAIPAGMALEMSTDNYALIVFSSGTTGAPVGALQTHGWLTTLALALTTRTRGPGNRTLSAIWPSTPAGLLPPLASLNSGAAVVFQPALRDHRSLADIIQTENVTYSVISPSQADGIVALAKEAGVAPYLPSLRMLMISGAICPPQTFAQTVALVTPHATVQYGAGAIGALAFLTGADLPAKSGSVGRIAPGFTVEVLDDAGQPVPSGEIGRLRARSLAPVPKLIGAPQPVGNPPPGDGWHYPGDLVRLDADGYLFILGREGEVINFDGIKIFAPDVEQALAPCPGLREVAVVAQADAVLGQVPVAFAVVDPGITVADLETFARVHLATSKRPHRWVLIDALPRGNFGKVLKRELVAQLAGGA